jgi:hypothetical protein
MNLIQGWIYRSFKRIFLAMLVSLPGCATNYSHESYDQADKFEVIDVRPGRVIEKIEYVSNEQWESKINNSGMPVGWTSGNILMDGVITYLHYSMFGTTQTFRPGSTYAYLISVSDEDKIRVLSKFSGFNVNECVKVLFGKDEVRIAPGDNCTEIVQ